MVANKVVRLQRHFTVSLMALLLAGCVAKPDTPPPDKAPEPVAKDAAEAVRALPVVTLLEAKVIESANIPAKRVHITADGPFGSNVIKKSDPERIIVIVHNAQMGKVPQTIEVNDGTISRLETAQLDTGRSPAVRITIGLAGNADFKVVPDQSAIMVDISKKQ